MGAFTGSWARVQAAINSPVGVGVAVAGLAPGTSGQSLAHQLRRRVKLDQNQGRPHPGRDVAQRVPRPRRQIGGVENNGKSFFQQRFQKPVRRTEHPRVFLPGIAGLRDQGLAHAVAAQNHAGRPPFQGRGEVGLSGAWQTAKGYQRSPTGRWTDLLQLMANGAPQRRCV